MNERWTKDEIDYLKNNYPKNGAQFCAENLNRTIDAIRKQVRRHQIKYTSRNHKFNNLVGNVYGYLEVKKFLHISERREAQWECKCKCGKIIKAKTGVLTSGNTKSCGCYRIDLIYKGGKYLTGTQFCKIQREAKYRKIECSISIEDLEGLIEKQNHKCKISGVPICFNKNKKGKIEYHNASVDRINSSKGYIKDNIQLVTKDINMAKQRLSNQEFINLCHQISDYQRGKNINVDN